jgi:regulator of sigma E protease
VFSAWLKAFFASVSSSSTLYINSDISVSNRVVLMLTNIMTAVIVVIAKIGGDVIQNNGFFSGLLLTAVISLNLALVNFLPIPALDGGHFMFLLIEKIRRKPLDEVTINKISSVFFLLLILLMVLVVFNDVYALIIHKF